MSFAILPVVALLPMGLNIQRQSIDATVSTQIISRVIHEVQQTNYSNLPTSTPLTFCFDDQGNLLASGSDGTLFQSCTNSLRLYDAQATITKPTGIPGSLVGGSSQNLGTVKIGIASNPGHSATLFNNTDVNGNYINSAVSTYFSFVSKND